MKEYKKESKKREKNETHCLNKRKKKESKRQNELTV